MLLPQGFCALKPQLGGILRGARRARRLKQSVLAADIGISRETLSRLETGKRLPRPQPLDRLMTILELEWEDVATRGYVVDARIFISGYRGDQLILIGKKLQEIRLGKGYTLVEMAKYLNSSPATLSRLERGQLARSRFFQDNATYAEAELESRPVVIVHDALRALLT